MKFVLQLKISLAVLAFSVAAVAGPGRDGREGGGGNVIPAKKLDPKFADSEILDGLQHAKFYLFFYLNTMELQTARFPGRYKDTEFLFKGKQNVYNFIDTLSIEYRYNGPCFEADGAAKAGSIYSSRPGAICISSPMVAQQVNSEDVDAQVAALILHEVAHLMGADEDRAVAIQEMAFRTLRGQNLEALEPAMEHLMSKFLLAAAYGVGIPYDLSGYSEAEQCAYAVQADGAFNTAISAALNSPMAFFDLEEILSLQNWGTRINEISEYICYNTKFNPSMGENSAKPRPSVDLKTEVSAIYNWMTEFQAKHNRKMSSFIDVFPVRGF